MGKRFFRCIVCGDVHYGSSPPETCPTCMQANKYVEIDPGEAKRVFGF
jgi:rubrerythrin